MKHCVVILFNKLSRINQNIRTTFGTHINIPNFLSDEALKTARRSRLPNGIKYIDRELDDIC